MSSRIVWRLSGRKISASLRFVMRSVFEGPVGEVRGGRVDRSMDMVEDLDALEDGREAGGELSADISISILKIERTYARGN